MKFCPKKYHFYVLLAKWWLTFFFCLSILDEFFFPPGNMFIWTNFFTKQLEFFEKNVRMAWTGSKIEFFPEKYHFFLSIFTSFLTKCDTGIPFFFCRFLSNFLFLSEICLFELTFYKTTRFFWQNVKTASKMDFCSQKYPSFFIYSYSFFGFPINAISLEDF
jgi:hypothetical protein